MELEKLVDNIKQVTFQDYELAYSEKATHIEKKSPLSLLHDYQKVVLILSSLDSNETSVSSHRLTADNPLYFC